MNGRKGRQRNRKREGKAVNGRRREIIGETKPETWRKERTRGMKERKVRKKWIKVMHK